MNQPNSVDRFPLSIASGEAFCNRVDETRRLVHCIEHRRPVLLISPRRYGKTSLALHAIHKSKLPYAHIDFFSAVDELDIQRAILNGVSKLISSMESIPKKAIALATDIFEGSRVRAVISKLGFSLEIDSKIEKPSQHILDVLERLESLAVKTNKKLVLFFDEFQCMGELAPDQAMEGVLRQVAQLTQSISFVFSGSNRHLLNQLFEDRKRPFYKLCERITLDRIHEKDYEPHIESSAKITWGDRLDNDALTRLFSITERHPYYLNLLCSRLMHESEKPTLKTIESLWFKYVNEERSHVGSEVDLLSKNQKKLLTILSRVDGTSSPLGREFLHLSKMSKTSIDQSLTFLERHDYVIKKDGVVMVLDPLIKSALSILH